ncbi:flagellar basal body-associated FliL family protein [Pseudomaricurvus sp.]|uniref:flagellar basal body-associated FliL family protein n=1 Tax=Pseudomaricurvus sp. TaxID=2004510 RepID=UPI003F6B02E2
MKVQKNLVGLSLLIRTLVLVLPLILTSPVWAEDEPEEEETVAAEGEEQADAAEGEEKASSIYLPLKPPFVVNYGNNEGALASRLHYLKAELTVRVGTPKDVNSIRHHMPYIRNQLIMLFSKQTQESLETQEGKELLRQKAHAAIYDLVMAEEGELDLIGVYFNQLILQN